jgi:hypothetical protein
MCMSGDGDFPLFEQVKMRRAAKPYRCSECGGPIRVHDRYEYFVGKWEKGEPVSVFRTCNTCIDGMRDWLQRWCDGWIFSAVMEDFMEHASDPESHGVLDAEDKDYLYGLAVCDWLPERVQA